MSAITLKTADEIALMREAGRIVARVHAAMRQAVAPGVSTAELDRIAADVLAQHGATAAFIGYPKPDSPPYPATINASLNDQLVHGIPRADCILREGDIISLDVGAFYAGFVADAAFTMAVGKIPPQVQRLLDVTEQSLYAGIAASRAGATTADIGYAVQRYVERHGYSVVRDYSGHGLGRAMHEDPSIPNFWSRAVERRGWKKELLRPGMTFAIEPMVAAGRPETKELDDHWTVVTKDGSLCAHFEHSLAVTEGDPIILTLL